VTVCCVQLLIEQDRDTEARRSKLSQTGNIHMVKSALQAPRSVVAVKRQTDRQLHEQHPESSEAAPTTAASEITPEDEDVTADVEPEDPNSAAARSTRHKSTAAGFIFRALEETGYVIVFPLLTDLY
jgi:hypothetical protein